MISQEQMSTIAEMIGTTADEFAKAYSDEKEVKLTLPEGRFLTKDNEAILLDNHGKKKYDEGVKKTNKDIFEGKTKEEYEAELKQDILKDFKKEPNKKIEELELSISNLQKTVTDKETELNNVNTTFAAEKLNYTIKSKIPNNKIGLSNDVVLAEMKANGYDFAEDNGVINVTKNGQVLKDTLQNPLKFTDVATQFLSDKNWLTEKRGGRGGTDETGSSITIKSMEDFEAYTKKENINPNSQEALAVLREAKKENNF